MNGDGCNRMVREVGKLLISCKGDRRLDWNSADWVADSKE